MAFPKWIVNKNSANSKDFIDEMFEQAFSGTANRAAALHTFTWSLAHHRFQASAENPCRWYPDASFRVSERTIWITAQLPGVRKEDIYVAVKHNVLIMKGERPAEEILAAGKHPTEDACSATFQRTFILPETVHPRNIRAEFSGEILTVEISRRRPA